MANAIEPEQPCNTQPAGFASGTQPAGFRSNPERVLAAEACARESALECVTERRTKAARFRSKLNALVVGVGGQGAVLASRLVADACMARGQFVRTAETIGMAQRGGSVASHVRVAAGAEELPVSLIGAREADLILAFEPGEAVRAAGFLSPGGSVVCAMRPVVPSATAASGYDGQAQLAWLRQNLPAGHLAEVDPGVLVREGLSPRCLNVLLLGAAVGLGALPFGADELESALRRRLKPKLVNMNLRALALGQALA